MVRRLPDKDVKTVKISVLIPTTGDIATVREHAAMADQLGYDSVNCSHNAEPDDPSDRSADRS